jgi:Uma2 family endonuclease
MATVSREQAIAVEGQSIDRFSVEPSDHYEVVHGKIEEKPAMGVFESLIATELLGWLHRWPGLMDHGRMASETLFVLDAAKDLKYRPYLAFVSFGRWARNQTLLREEAWDVVPDLAIEVISSSNLATKVIIKIRDYFRHGVRCVWVVYPVEELVYVYDSPTILRGLTRDDALESADILSGFQLPLSQLFEAGATTS